MKWDEIIYDTYILFIDTEFIIDKYQLPSKGFKFQGALPATVCRTTVEDARTIESVYY